MIATSTLLRKSKTCHSVPQIARFVSPLADIPIIEKSAHQGRTWIDAPPDLRQGEPTSYIPKTCVHTWSGHTKGVHKIQWFPGTGHLLLSASMDGKVKIWDVYNSRKCMRTYSGHTKPVRDVSFSADGKTFASAGYDKVSPHTPGESHAPRANQANNHTITQRTYQLTKLLTTPMTLKR